MNLCKIPLTPGQAVSIHGWFNPRAVSMTLSWTDVLPREDLTLQTLHFKYNVTLELLHRLQGDLSQWIRSGRAKLEDVPMMTMWKAHPIHDFKADLGDLIGMGWKSEQYKLMNVTYSDLVEVGMTADTMAIFRFTLYEWSLLGFTKAHAVQMMPHALANQFGMTKENVLRCLLK